MFIASECVKAVGCICGYMICKSDRNTLTVLHSLQHDYSNSADFPIQYPVIPQDFETEINAAENALEIHLNAIMTSLQQHEKVGNHGRVPPRAYT